MSLNRAALLVAIATTLEGTLLVFDTALRLQFGVRLAAPAWNLLWPATMAAFCVCLHRHLALRPSRRAVRRTALAAAAPDILQFALPSHSRAGDSSTHCR